MYVFHISHSKSEKRIFFIHCKKNNGFVSHYAYCYGNFPDTTAILLQFDTNVVPSADYIRDYEELWTEQARQSPTFRRIINSSTSQKGYYIESINNNAATEEEKTSVDYIIP